VRFALACRTEPLDLILHESPLFATTLSMTASSTCSVRGRKYYTIYRVQRLIHRESIVTVRSTIKTEEGEQHVRGDFVVIRTIGLVFFASFLNGQNQYTISTLAGGCAVLTGYTGDGGPAIHARLNKPSGLALGPLGELYISDTWNNVVRLVEATGKIRTIAGTGAEGFGGDGGPATQAKLLFPRGLALDSHGNLYIADTQNNRIRLLTPEGTISTFAGTGQRGYGGDGGPAINATLNWPDGIAIDASDVIYFTDSQNNLVRKITPDGVITKVAGSAPIGKRSANPAGPFDFPSGISLDRDGNIYVADRDHHRVAKVSRDGTVSTVAGDGLHPSLSRAGSADGGRALATNLGYPRAVALDPNGDLLIATENIRKVGRDGSVTTVLGSQRDSLPGADLDPLKMRLGSPDDIVVDRHGDVYVADSGRSVVLRMSPNGTLAVVAGLSALPDEKDGGPADTLRLSNSWSVAAGPAGDIFVADSDMNRIVRIAADGRFHRVAGKGEPIIRIEGLGPPPQFSGDGGPALAADLDYPFGVAVDSHGTLYISDAINNRVRKVSADGIIETIAGIGEAGSSGDGGRAREARLSSPSGLAVDSHGNVYVADCGSNSVRQISSDGMIRTVVGGLKCPHGVFVDAKDTLFIADTFNHFIKRLDPDGTVRTIAGTGKQEFTGDEGPASEAGLAAPDSLAIDSQGNIYIADRANWRVRKITRDGTIHTIAGNHEPGFSGDGGPALKAPIFPTSVAVDVRGRVYVTDHNRIRVLTPTDQ
jgi:sugar lactone lactonase YvrE